MYYFYMKSLEQNIKKTEIQILKPVVDYNEKFLKIMDEHYNDIKLTCLDLYMEERAKDGPTEDDSFVRNVILDYQTKKMDYGKLTKVKCTDIRLNKYQSIFREESKTASTFESSIQFFDDLFTICDELKKYTDKKEKVMEYTKVINENLPSTAYVPFSKSRKQAI
jgi:hypothetical protein